MEEIFAFYQKFMGLKNVLREGLYDEFYETSLPSLEDNEFKPLLDELSRI